MRLLSGALHIPGGGDAAVLRHALMHPSPALGEPPPKPPRPPSIPAARWRRMSAMTRCFASLAAPQLIGLSEVSIVHGSVFGDLVQSSSVLDRVFLEGPEMVSPLAFQNSVHNAAPGHVSMAFGLHGPSETLSAGGVSTAMCLLRAQQMLHNGASHCLLLVGDWASDTVLRAHALVPFGAPPATVLAAALFDDGPGGCQVQVHAGPPRAQPVFARHLTHPDGERSPVLPAGTYDQAPALGAAPSAGLAMLLAAAEGGGAVLEHDDGSLWSIEVAP